MLSSAPNSSGAIGHITAIKQSTINSNLRYLLKRSPSSRDASETDDSSSFSGKIDRQNVGIELCVNDNYVRLYLVFKSGLDMMG